MILCLAILRQQIPGIHTKAAVGQKFNLFTLGVNFSVLILFWSFWLQPLFPTYCQKIGSIMATRPVLMEQTSPWLPCSTVNPHIPWGNRPSDQHVSKIWGLPICNVPKNVNMIVDEIHQNIDMTIGDYNIAIAIVDLAKYEFSHNTDMIIVRHPRFWATDLYLR